MTQPSGLNRDMRIKAVRKGKNITLLDTALTSLQEQAIALSSIINYYDNSGQPKGSFAPLITRLKNNKADGNEDPSVALIRIFLENLQQVTLNYNKQWKHYPEWYLKDILRIEGLQAAGNKIWVSLEPFPQENLFIAKGTRFITQNAAQQPLYYAAIESMEFPNTTLEKAFLFSLVQNPYKVSDKNLAIVSSVNFKELQILAREVQPLKENNTDLGIKMTSPALLLKEGIRTVIITFYPSDKQAEITKKLINYILQLANYFTSEENLQHKNVLLKNIFSLTISTTEGWTAIQNYSIDSNEKDKSLILTFTLDEQFPSTIGCSKEKHNFTSKYPKLNIALNPNAWVYPYSWIKDLFIGLVKIETKVSNISHIDAYNEFGTIDISTPFAPFGINVSKGKWMTFGNYEMAVKNSKKVNLDIRWGQLPDHTEGLFGYYKSYNQDIDNQSFTLNLHYLKDYEWNRTKNIQEPRYLFATGEQNDEPARREILYNKTCISTIIIDEMPPVKIAEEEYGYTQQTRSGFVRLSIQSPAMGFGEGLYHKLFTDQLIKKAKKKETAVEINPPINPIIERMTLSYEAEDFIHVNKQDEENAIDFILPFDTLDYFPINQKTTVPIAVTLDQNNILFALKNVKAGSTLNLFFTFKPEQDETITTRPNPIHWYIGHMRNWELIPESVLIQKDETMRLSVSGRIQFKLPLKIDSSLYDHEGLLWIRAGVQTLNQLESIAPNPIQLQLDAETIRQGISFKHALPKLAQEVNIPGLAKVHALTHFFEGTEQETTEETMIRVAEYISHKGRAVTARDYERLVLQEFNDIGTTLCYQQKKENSIIVKIAVLPAHYMEKPLVSNYTMLKIERFINSIKSPYAQNIQITNPTYEKVVVRLILQPESKDVYLSNKNVQRILAIVNLHIAPWQYRKRLPAFGYQIDIDKMYNSILTKLKAVHVMIQSLQLFCIKANGEPYVQHTYTPKSPDKQLVYPSHINTLFIPANEHIIHVVDENKQIPDNYGISEMKLGDTFIIQ